MAKFEQGVAPAALFSGPDQLWQFTMRKLETSDPALCALLVEHGAVCIEADEATPDVKVAKVVFAPTIFDNMTKLDIVAYAKNYFGVDISPNQAKASIIEKAVAAAQASVKAELVAPVDLAGPEQPAAVVDGETPDEVEPAVGLPLVPALIPEPGILVG